MGASSRWLVLVGLAALTGCPQASSPSSSGDKLYLGTIAGDSTSGTITVVVHPAEGGSTPAVDAKISTSGGSGGTGGTIISGTKDGNDIEIDDDGWSLRGQVESGGLTGTLEDPSGNDSLFTANDASSNDVARYCGQFAGGDSGTWNLQVGGGKANGAFSGGFASGVLHGTGGSSSIQLTFSGADASGDASGSVSNGSVSGTWATDDGFAEGSWNGSISACGAASQTTSADDCCTQTARGLACPIEGC